MVISQTLSISFHDIDLLMEIGVELPASPSDSFLLLVGLMMAME
jgi:hypothetical protein